MTEVDELNARITKRGLRWVAGETGLAVPSQHAEQERSLFGMSLTERQIEIAVETAEWGHRYIPAQAPPPKVDWRDRYGANWLSSIKSQGKVPACVAFAVLAAVEARIRIAKAKPRRKIDLSEAHLFVCGGGDLSTGGHLDDALRFLREKGVVNETSAPYDRIKELGCEDIDGPRTKSRAFTVISRKDLIKEVIAKNGPVVGGIEAHRDLIRYTSGIYAPSGGVAEHHHAVAVVGYDDVEGFWIIQNSWGVDWGEAGFGRIAYDSCELKFFYDPRVA